MTINWQYLKALDQQSCCILARRIFAIVLITTRFRKHYNDVIMTTMASQITSLTVVYSTVYSDADQRKHQSSASLAFVWGIHRDRWIPRTKGQLRGKCFHLMTSSWINAVSHVKAVTNWPLFCIRHICLNWNILFSAPQKRMYFIESWNVLIIINV